MLKKQAHRDGSENARKHGFSDIDSAESKYQNHRSRNDRHCPQPEFSRKHAPHIRNLRMSVREQPAQNQIDQAGDTGLININTADAAGLETLNGIGPARAQAIIDYRRTVSAFTAIEDIKNVAGIGNGIFSRIRDHITV